MSRQARKRKLRKNYNTVDSIASREHGAIKAMAMVGPVQQSRLNITYRVDGYVFNSGKKHRGGGVGVNPHYQDGEKK